MHQRQDEMAEARHERYQKNSEIKNRNPKQKHGKS